MPLRPTYMMTRTWPVAFAFAIFVALPAFADGPTSVASPSAQPPAYQQLYDGLGDVHHPVTTKSPQAQKYFDQGLAFNYGFNHDEAYQSFSTAAQLDPEMAMADWGVALVLGPNYNLPATDEGMKSACGAIQRAQSWVTSRDAAAKPEEKALIEALAKRYGSDGKQTPEREKAYADAMRAVAHKYPDDPDVQALFAESLMDLHPWALWTADGKPGPETVELVWTLETTLKKYPNHLGANHYLIHAVEASPHPERALASANRLASLAPAQGHIVHMPSHIYSRIGAYHEASEANVAAIKSDQTFLQLSHETGVYPVMYATHNIDFLFYDEMMEGRKRDAIKTARDLEDAVPPAIVQQMPMLAVMSPKLYFAIARFGAWDEILAELAPRKEFAYTNAMWHYARGLAFAAKGKFDDAEAEKKALDVSAASVPADLETGPNNKARDVTKLASTILAGTIASDHGDHSEAIRDFTEAVREQDALGYNEPPSWYYPVRETLGAELLADKKIAAAEKVYRDDLKKNPENPRSLYGLAQTLRAEGKNDEAAKVQHRFTIVWSHSDVTLAPITMAAQ